MSQWLIDIEREVKRANEAQRMRNAGRVRTAARRIAGIAIGELQRHTTQRFFGDDFIQALRAMAVRDSVPNSVAEAAKRLHAKLSSDFSSPSVDPLGDAMIIVEFVKSMLTESKKASTLRRMQGKE